MHVTVQTYNQSLDIGLMACGEALPETGELAAYVEAAFMEFQALPVATQAIVHEPRLVRVGPAREHREPLEAEVSRAQAKRPGQ